MKALVFRTLDNEHNCDNIKEFNSLQSLINFQRKEGRPYENKHIPSDIDFIIEIRLEL